VTAAPTVLRTRRLTLRPARPEDLMPMHAVFCEPAAMRYWSHPAHTTLDQTRAWLDATIAAPEAEASDFVIECDGRVIGKAGMWRRWEIGFILRPDHWRRGLAREALTAILDHIFATRDTDHLTAEADPRNVACLGLLASLGFTVTGTAERTLLWDDEWCDSVYLALDRATWVRAAGTALAAPPSS
jgi:RimJ/RimL family protein N-acetyltransferase